ncbi:DUF1328 family protein [Nevskia soli]|uniref:DUF1328 family protein n=1 Tax=Nevskia soli TaxID=418856 RepID=UPI0004A70549|nr:DUF1328 family protein [Nevskia soli]
MHYWSVIFLLIACMAGCMGMSGVAGISGPTAWGLALASLVLAALSILLSRKPEDAQQRSFRSPSQRNLEDV